MSLKSRVPTANMWTVVGLTVLFAYFLVIAIVFFADLKWSSLFILAIGLFPISAYLYVHLKRSKLHKEPNGAYLIAVADKEREVNRAYRQDDFQSICSGLVGLVAILAALVVWGYQGYLWLRYGEWVPKSWTLYELPVFQIDWIGLQIIINWIADWNIGVLILLVGALLYLLFRPNRVLSLENIERLELEAEKLRKSSPESREEEIDDREFAGNLHLTLPLMADWNFEYHIYHEISHYTVDLDAEINDVWWDTDEEETPSYLEGWIGKHCNLMINSYINAEDLERRKSHEELGEGWRAANDRFVIKIYVTNAEFRDLIEVMRQDHLRHDQNTKEFFQSLVAGAGAEVVEEMGDTFAPSELPRIRIDVMNTHAQKDDNFSNAEVVFRVSRIYA